MEQITKGKTLVITVSRSDMNLLVGGSKQNKKYFKII